MHRLVIASVTLVGLVGIAVVAGYLTLFAGSGDRAATLAPARTAFYANLYLQPSTGQQMNLSELIGRLPGFADDAALDDKIDQVTQNLLGLTGIDYRADVKPWLGDQVALAGWASGADPAQVATVVLVAVSDQEAARDAIPRLAGEGEIATETYEGVEINVAGETAFALLDGMLVVGNGAQPLHAVIDTSLGADSLAEQPAFTEAMDRVPDDHLASFYVDLAGIAEASGTTPDLAGATTASAALVAESEGLRLSGSAPLSGDATASPNEDSAAEQAILSAWMPERTLAEVTVFDLRGTLEQSLAVAGEVPEGETATSALDTVRALAAIALGVDLDEEVLPLLDGETAVALGGIGLDGAPSGQLLLRPPDPDAATGLLRRVADRIASSGGTSSSEQLEGIEVTAVSLPDTFDAAFGVVDGVVVIGLTPGDVAAVAEARESGLTLDATSAYREAFDVATVRAGTEAWVDVGTVGGFLGLAVELPDDARDILSGLGSFAITVPARPDEIEFHAVLTVD